jgi:23S rRNA (uracil1939-C5)-methyltransferase
MVRRSDASDARARHAYASPVVDQPGGQEIAVVRAERLVAGGAALSRRDDGRIVLVDDALPGELVEVRVTARHGADRGTVVQIIEPSADRITPACPHVADGCGGCDLAAFEHAAQGRAKVGIVTDALRRLGRWSDPVVRVGPSLDPWGFRTTLRLAVTHGRAGLRRATSNSVVELDHCAVAHPLLDELVAEGALGTATEVTFRVGAATGERLALVTPSRDGVRLPDDVRVVGADERAAGKRAWIHEIVAGRRWRISAGSFFQTRPDGAAALVDVVTALSAEVLDSAPIDADQPRTLLDAYSGVGLFAGALLADRVGWRAVTAESNRASVADAQVNLSDLDARVVATTVERWRAPRAELVIADPSRAGLGRAGAAVLAATGAQRIVLVSCDPAAAGRDVALLTGHGYQPSEAVVVDLFPHTHHTEVVTRFDRRSIRP